MAQQSSGENSHQPTRRRERKMQRFKSVGSAQTFLSTHAAYNTFNVPLSGLSQERTEPSGHELCRHGVKSSLRREPDVPGDLLRVIFGNVTKPENLFPLGN